MHAQIVIFDGFDPLDVIAPYEALSAAAELLHERLTVELVSAEGPRLVESGTPGISLTAAGGLDPHRQGIVLVPGASGAVDGDVDAGAVTIPVLLAHAGATALGARMREALEDPAVIVAAVCGGSLLLAMAGLLEGRRAVTHTLGNDVLEATGVHVVRARVVDDGDLVTCGGVTSGLDLALHLLDREFGSDIARAVETLFEYERRGIVSRAPATAPALAGAAA